MELSFSNKEKIIKKKIAWIYSIHGSLTLVLLVTRANTLSLFLRLQIDSCALTLTLHQTSMILKELCLGVVFHLLIALTGLFLGFFSQSKGERETDIFHY